MSGVNKVILIGNLGKDPEIRYMEGNIAKVRFSMATTEVYKDKTGTKTEHTEWHNVVLWRGLAESAHKLLHKGSQIYLEGKLHNNSWTDKEGNKKNVTEIIGENFIMLQRRENGANTSKPSFESNAENQSGEGLPY